MHISSNYTVNYITCTLPMNMHIYILYVYTVAEEVVDMRGG